MSVRSSLYYRKGAGGKVAVEDMSVSTGKRVFVHSGTGTDGSAYGFTPDKPYATLDYAIGQCTADKNDLILMMPGHAETYSTTGTKVTADVAGITIIGLGRGADRPTFTFGHTGATWSVTANGVTIENLLFVTSVDSVTTFATISGADCTVEGCEFRDTTDIEVITDLTVTGDRFTLRDCLKNGYTGGNANARVVSLNGADQALIEGCRFLTKVTTAVIGTVSNACAGLAVRNSVFLVEGTTDLSKDVVDGATGSSWSVDACMDIGAGAPFSGGSGGALAGDDVSALTASVSVVRSTAQSVGIQTSTVNSKVDSVGIQASTVTSKADSVGATASAVSSKTDSVGVTASTVSSKADSVGLTASTVSSKADSVGLTASTVQSKADSVGISASTLISKLDSVALVVSAINSKTV